ncbi:hypothetical protein Tco_0645463 [Tanacetum coccineum]
MASDGSKKDTRYALSKLLQRRTVAEYEREAFSIARIMEAHFESIEGKKLNIEEKIDIVLSWTSEEAPPVIEGSLDANEDIGVVEVSSAIDDVFDIEVVVGGGEAYGVGEDELNRVIPVLKDGGGEIDGLREFANYGKELVSGKVIFEGVGSVTAWVAKGGRMVLCYVQGSGRRKRKKGVGCGSRRQENYGSGRRDCDRIRIWDSEIKRVFQDNTLRIKWFRKSGE